MKTLNNFITEKLKITKNTKVIIYKYFPKNRDELRDILEERLREDKNANLNDIDVSKITNMYGLFVELNPYNINISDWDISNVKDMGYMFNRCENFNCDLSKWDVSNVDDMRCMFHKCHKLNCNLSKWDIDDYTITYSMFEGCTTLEKNNLIPSWYKK